MKSFIFIINSFHNDSKLSRQKFAIHKKSFSVLYTIRFFGRRNDQVCNYYFLINAIICYFELKKIKPISLSNLQVFRTFFVFQYKYLMYRRSISSKTALIALILVIYPVRSLILSKTQNDNNFYIFDVISKL